MVGDLQTELVHDFFEGFAQGARANVHVKVLYGRSSHHHIEAVFKAFAPGAARGLLAATAGWRACCRARRGCCDRAHRLRRRQSDVRPEGLRRRRGGAFHAGGAVRPRCGRAGSSSRASATSARRRMLDGRVDDRDPERRRRAGCRSSASVLACNGCSRGATKRRASPGLGAITGRVLAAAAATAEGPARRLELARGTAAIAAARRHQAGERRCTSRTRSPRP